MKVISLKELKDHLSEYAQEAADGTSIEVTRYNRPFIHITGIQSPGVHVGARVGKSRLGSCGRALSGGAYLSILDEDRGAKE